MRIATSLSPKAFEHQLGCVRNLVSRGFDVVLLQARNETNRPAIHGVTYRDSNYGPPTIDELLAALPDEDYGGIINSDVMFTATAGEVRSKLDQGVPICGQRWECNEWWDPQAVFTAGFDFFFFHGGLKRHLSPSHFRIGKPAWDYWVPMRLLEHGPLVLITEPLAFHVKHETRWNAEDYKGYCDSLTARSPKHLKGSGAVQAHILRSCKREPLRDVGSVAIFIRSFARDIPFLEYNMRSIQKFASGFSEVLVTVPMKDRAAFLPLSDKWCFKLHAADEPEGKGMLHAEVRLCRADELCPSADFVLFTDSDCVFTERVCPQDYFVDGKPVLFVESFEKLAREKSPRVCWRKPVVDALGFDPEYETMCRHPAVHPSWIFPKFREAVERHVMRPFDEYVLAQRNEYPQTFAEFDSLGALAVRDYIDHYHFADVDAFTAEAISMSGGPIRNNKILQNWSHGGVKPDVRAKLEALLR